MVVSPTNFLCLTRVSSFVNSLFDWLRAWGFTIAHNVHDFVVVLHSDFFHIFACSFKLFHNLISNSCFSVDETWSQPIIKGTPPTSQAYHTCTTVGDDLFVFGGTDGKNPLKDLHVLNTCELFLLFISN